jgi:hypothetical protein
MKKVKIAFWVIVLFFAGVFVYQNKVFFMAKQRLSLDLPFLEVLHTPELLNAILFLVFFVTGFLIAYFFSLYERFKSKKTIKSLNATEASQREELTALKQELESLRRAPSSDAVKDEAHSTEQSV